jgi:glycerophosphoryl diester phosphodiesterase
MEVDLIAHRCGTDEYPEQSLESALRSRELGADYIELDIRFTKDEVPVISHDATAQRLFGDPSRICDLTSNEFLALKYLRNPSYGTNTLATFLESGVGKILMHIKEGRDRLETIAKCINKYLYDDKAVFGVVTAADSRAVKRLCPETKILAFASSEEMIPSFMNEGADIIRLWEGWVTSLAVDTIHRNGKKVWIMAGAPNDGSAGYTNDSNVADWLTMGVDGILVNEVSKVKRLLASR